MIYLSLYLVGAVLTYLYLVYQFYLYNDYTMDTSTLALSQGALGLIWPITLTMVIVSHVTRWLGLALSAVNGGIRRLAEKHRTWYDVYHVDDNGVVTQSERTLDGSPNLREFYRVVRSDGQYILSRVEGECKYTPLYTWDRKTRRWVEYTDKSLLA